MTPPAERAPTLDVRRLLLKTLLTLLALSAVAAALGFVLREPIRAMSATFVASWGGWGIALGFFIPDATALPIPHDLFLLLGLAGGLPIWQIIVFASTGSILGGCVAFLGSQLVRHIPAVEAKLAARSAEVHALVERYGVFALAFGALAPLPYSLTAWACGLLGMRFPVFLAVSTLRVVRVALYLGLVKVGLVSAGL